jgi:hypothetical protein
MHIFPSLLFLDPRYTLTTLQLLLKTKRCSKYFTQARYLFAPKRRLRILLHHQRHCSSVPYQDPNPATTFLLLSPNPQVDVLPHDSSSRISEKTHTASSSKDPARRSSILCSTSIKSSTAFHSGLQGQFLMIAVRDKHH